MYRFVEAFLVLMKLLSLFQFDVPKKNDLLELIKFYASNFTQPGREVKIIMILTQVFGFHNYFFFLFRVICHATCTF